MPKVSVLMGIYNCADTLEEAVDCIINQTFTDWELIMCDDCSSDNTYEIALKIAENDSRITVLKNDTNLTLAPTLNKCASIAKGKYLARMDGDDVCSLDRFEKEVEALDKYREYAVVSSWMNMYDESGVFRTVEYKKNPQKKDLLKSSQFCHAGCMMRKEVFDSIGGYSESAEYKRVEDYDLWVRMYKLGYVGFNIQEPLYSMRDDRSAINRRTYYNRINEARVKKNVVNWFGLSVLNYPFVLIPILKIFVPRFIYGKIHKNK